MSTDATKSGASTPSDNVEISGETDEGFVQVESKKKSSVSPKKLSVADKKAEIAAAIGDDDPLVKTIPTSVAKESPATEESASVAEAAGGGDTKGGGWWGGFGGLVQAAKTTAAKVGSAAEAALNELTKDDEVEEGQETEEGWENAGDAEVAAGKKVEGVPRSESNQSDSWGIGGWIQAAKDKTVAGAGAAAGVLDLVRRDLTEFTQETGSAVTSTASRLKDRLHITENVSSVFNAVSGAFYIPPEDEGEEAILVTDSDALVLGRFEKDLHDLRRDSKTYTADPDDTQAFKEWADKFDVSAKQQEMSGFLVKFKELRDNYARVVPAKATHAEFWQRYFFKVEQLEAAEEKRKEIKKRAEEAVAAAGVEAEVGKETSDWDDDVM